MARHQKNLLEAFQSANDERLGADPASAGPFASTPSTAPPAAPRENVLPSFSPRDLRVVFGVLGWGLLTFVIGLLVGRQFGPEQAFAGGSESSLAEALEAGSTFDAGLEPGPAVNEAFDDPANRYTVLAWRAADGAAGEEEAWAVYAHLADLALPVAYPMAYDGQVYVLVGAAGEAEDLAKLEAHLRGRTGPDGASLDFAEAFVVRIDSLLGR